MAHLSDLDDEFEGLESWPRANGHAREPRFPLVPFDSVRLGGDRAYVVKGLIPRPGLTVFWGPPKCGKSYLVFDLMTHVALGWEYRGRRVEAGAVVYLALEGADGFRARIEAFRLKKLAADPETVQFFLMSRSVDLIADRAQLIVDIQAQLGTINPVAIAIDTLNRSLAGSESDDRDMANYIRAADALRDAFRCAVVIVHHCGVDASRPRGHTSLTGAADAQIAVKRDVAGNIVATVEWMKDGPEGDTLVSRLEPVEVGMDTDGDPVTACIVAPVDAVHAPKKTAKQPKLTKSAGAALLALRKAIGDMGSVPPSANQIPEGVKAVTVDQWKDYAQRTGVSGSDKPDSVQKAFKRACDELVAEKRIAVWSPYVWTV